MNCTSRDTNQKVHFIVNHPKLTLGMGIIHIDLSMNFDGGYTLSIFHPHLNLGDLSIDWEAPVCKMQGYGMSFDDAVHDLYISVYNKFDDYVFENDDTYTKARLAHNKMLQTMIVKYILIDEQDLLDNNG